MADTQGTRTSAGDEPRDRLQQQQRQSDARQAAQTPQPVLPPRALDNLSIASNAPAALDALSALDTDRARLASDYYERNRVPTVIWVTVIYGMITLTYWLIPQVFLNRFHQPGNPAWLIFTLLAVSVLLVYAMLLFTCHMQGVAIQWLPPRPVMKSRRFRIILAVHAIANFIPAAAALAVGYATNAWWSAVAVTAVGAAFNGFMEHLELSETIRALRQRTTPMGEPTSDGETHHGVG